MSLSALAIQARSIAITAQTAHWFARGTTFNQDHALLGDLYTQFTAYVDQFAERSIGTGNDDIASLSPKTQAESLQAVPDCDFSNAVESLTCLLSLMTSYLQQLDAANAEASVGTQDLIAGVADAVEVSVYLVTQRLKSVV